MRSRVERDGFVLQKELAPHLSTVEVARRLGTILNVETILPSSGIPTVQCLRPRETRDVKQNQYSGNYGLNLFPLHTDLAHWIVPPRYFLLRCLVGAEDVFTNLLPCTYIVRVVGTSTLRKAVLRIRKRRFGCSGLVRALSSHQKEEIFRWDPLFLEPLNSNAHALKRVMFGPACNEAVIRVRLQRPGDTLLVDNWRMLHGRSPVSARSTARHIERIYVSEVFDDC
jgi:L-asparagine oxygenase